MKMLIPKEFAVEDREQMVAFIRRNAFATVICSARSNEPDELAMVKIPLLVKAAGERVVLEGHMAAIGPVAKVLAEHPLATIMFDGAHDYISPRWYQDQVFNVPTWNYSTVVCEVECRLHRDQEWLTNSLLELSRQYEPDRSWEEGVDPRFFAKLTGAIVGIEAEVTAMTAQFKLSQNKSPADRASVADHLRAAGNTRLADDMTDS